MQVLRLLAARRGTATTIVTAPTAAPEPAADSSEAAAVEIKYDDGDDDGEGSFFELDLSVRASSSSASGSSDDSDDASLADLDFVISLPLHRSRSAEPSCSSHFPAPPLLKPGAGAGTTTPPLRTLSFAGATAASARNAAALHGGRRSSFARSSRSLRLFMESPASPAADADQDPDREPRRLAPSRDAIRRYLTKISTRLRRSVRPRRGDEAAGLRRRLRKSRSASAAVTASTTTAAAPAQPSRRDDSLAEKQDGIASAIAHCKESLHRAASLPMSPSSERGRLPRSRSDPGNRQAP